ncbi:MAG: glycosyltransferase family 4 protein [Ignavibacteriales bacterium]|nr:glycosyltransferase family 4 protein [Melioribacteraceae bacterium]MCF8315134.1 glycosyltransferase family 4 protein [Ignavibacteriales bacterium]MCF8435870.1 glycosyltransferase family 4 protein [Ignavibacteriales bacterium]
MEIFYYSLIDSFSNLIPLGILTSCIEYQNSNVSTLRFKKRFFGIPGTGRFYAIISAFVKIIINRKEIKLIHFPYTGNAGKWGYVFYFVKKILKLDFILMIHGGGMLKWEKYDGNRLLFKHAKEIIAVSHPIKVEYEKRTGRNMQVIFPLVPFKKYNKTQADAKKEIGLSENSLVLVFIGTLKEIKNPLKLFEAVKYLGINFVEKHSIKLVYIGTGPLETILADAIIEAKMEEYISLRGYKKYEEVPVYFRSADIYIIPSLSEGTSKSLLEAMFNQLPIVASDVSGINNVLTDKYDALLFNEADPHDLAAKLKLVVEGIVDRNLLGKNAFDTYNRLFSYEKMMAELEKFYNK